MIEQRLVGLSLTSLPMWVMDDECGRIRWANDAAVSLFQARSSAELLARDFSDFSEASRARMARNRIEFQAGRDVWDSWTIYPKGKPTTVRLHVRAFTLDDGRTGGLCEAYVLHQGPEPCDLRGVEALRHTSMMVALLAPTGDVLMENPAMSRAFQGTRFGEWFCEPTIADAVLSVLTQGAPYQSEARARTTEGLRWHLLDGRRTLDPVTGAPAVLLQQVDVTLQHEDRATIQQQNQQILELQRAQQLTIQHQDQEIARLCAPIIAVGRHLAVLPIIGTCDVERLDRIRESVLVAIVKQRLKHVIVDLTGVLAFETMAVRKLVQITEAIRLIGATPSVTGIQSALAPLLAADGGLAGIAVFRDLRRAVAALTASK